jgi:ketopantoate reductase
MTTEPILIWGAGAIGGTLGAYWARAGIPVLLVDDATDVGADEHEQLMARAGAR